LLELKINERAVDASRSLVPQLKSSDNFRDSIILAIHLETSDRDTRTLAATNKKQKSAGRFQIISTNLTRIF
jgi:hypothetical protein